MVAWNVRTGASLRKQYKAVQKEKKSRYKCDVCGTEAVRRVSAGIWHCKHCGATFAGGAYTPRTEAGSSIERLISQIKVKK